MDNNKKIIDSSPGLGLIFGAGAGILIGAILKQNITLFTFVGASLGLIIGAIVYTIFKIK